MNKPQTHGKLMPMREFAAIYKGKNGKPVSKQYIHKLIQKHRRTGKETPFKYVVKNGVVWIRIS